MFKENRKIAIPVGMSWWKSVRTPRFCVHSGVFVSCGFPFCVFPIFIVGRIIRMKGLVLIAIILFMLIFVVRSVLFLIQYRKTEGVERKLLQIRMTVWVGTAPIAVGIYNLVVDENMWKGILYLIIGIGLILEGRRRKQLMEKEKIPE